MSRVFWDTNLFIYLLEDKGELMTSALTLGEILVKPKEAGQEVLVEKYSRTDTPDFVHTCYAPKRFAPLSAASVMMWRLPRLQKSLSVTAVINQRPSILLRRST